jgi:phosphoenolpyruvate carboxylase
VFIKLTKEKLKKKQGTNVFTLLEDAIDRLLKQKSISKEKFYQVAKSLKVDLVLTAHPTEVRRRTLIQKYHKIIEILEQRDLYKSNSSKLIQLNKHLYDEFTIIGSV